MCFGSSGAPTPTSSNTSVTTSSPPSQFLNAYTGLVNQAQQQAGTPLTQYGGPLVAGFTPQQQQGFQTVQNLQGSYAPYINAAAQEFGNASGTNFWNTLPKYDTSNLPTQGLQNFAGAANIGNTVGNSAYTPVSASDIAAYENPFQSSVTNALTNLFNQQNAQQLSQVRGNAGAQNALGGDREAVAEALTAQQQQLAEAPTLANVGLQGWQSALGAAQQQKQSAQQQQQLNLAGGQLGLQAGAQQLGQFNTQQQQQLAAEQAQSWLESQAGFGLANLGSEAQNLGLSGAQANIQAGGAQQNLAQQQLNIPYEQFIQQQAYPYQQLNWLSGIVEGAGGLAGGSSQTTVPGPSTLGQVAGLGLAGAGALGASGAFGNNGWLTGGGGLFGSNDPTSTFDTAQAEGQATTADLSNIFSSMGGRVGRAHGGRIGLAGGGPPVPGGALAISSGVPDVSVSYIPAFAQGPGANSPMAQILKPQTQTVQQSSSGSSGGGGGGILGDLGAGLGIGKFIAGLFARGGGVNPMITTPGLHAEMHSLMPHMMGTHATSGHGLGLPRLHLQGGGTPVAAFGRNGIDETLMGHAPTNRSDQTGDHSMVRQAPPASDQIEMQRMNPWSPGGSNEAGMAAADRRRRIGLQGGGTPTLDAATPLSGFSPNVQGEYQQFTQLPMEKLQELAARVPPTSYQGMLIQRALNAKRMNPGSGTAQPAAPTMSPLSLPFGSMMPGMQPGPGMQPQGMGISPNLGLAIPQQQPQQPTAIADGGTIHTQSGESFGTQKPPQVPPSSMPLSQIQAAAPGLGAPGSNTALQNLSLAVSGRGLADGGQPPLAEVPRNSQRYWGMTPTDPFSGPTSDVLEEHAYKDFESKYPYGWGIAEGAIVPAKRLNDPAVNDAFVIEQMAGAKQGTLRDDPLNKAMWDLRSLRQGDQGPYSSPYAAEQAVVGQAISRGGRTGFTLGLADGGEAVDRLTKMMMIPANDSGTWTVPYFAGQAVRESTPETSANVVRLPANERAWGGRIGLASGGLPIGITTYKAGNGVDIPQITDTATLFGGPGVGNNPAVSTGQGLAGWNSPLAQQTAGSPPNVLPLPPGLTEVANDSSGGGGTGVGGFGTAGLPLLSAAHFGHGGRMGFAAGGDPDDGVYADLPTEARALLPPRERSTPLPPRTNDVGDVTEDQARGVGTQVPPVAPNRHSTVTVPPGLAGPHEGALTPPVGQAAAPPPPSQTGEGFTPAGLQANRGFESAGVSTATNLHSSAMGADQFLKGTWLDLIKSAHPDIAAGKTDAELLAMRSDPNLSAQMTQDYAKANAGILRQHGLPVNDTTLSLSHNFGGEGAAKILAADPKTPMSQLVSAQALTANPWLNGKTAGDVIASRGAMMSGAARRPGGGGLQEAPPAGGPTMEAGLGTNYAGNITGEGGSQRGDGIGTHSAHNDFLSSPWMIPLAVGAGMLASRSPYAGVQLGEGLETGIKVAGQQNERETKAEVAEARARAAGDVADIRRQSVQQQGQHFADQFKTASDNLALRQQLGAENLTVKQQLADAATQRADTALANARSLDEQRQIREKLQSDLNDIKNGKAAVQFGHENPEDPNSTPGYWSIPAKPDPSSPNKGATFFPTGAPKPAGGGAGATQAKIDALTGLFGKDEAGQAKVKAVMSGEHPLTDNEWGSLVQRYMSNNPGTNRIQAEAEVQKTLGNRPGAQSSGASQQHQQAPDYSQYEGKIIVQGGVRYKVTDGVPIAVGP